jgi:hypothetical protein
LWILPAGLIWVGTIHAFCPQSVTQKDLAVSSSDTGNVWGSLSKFQKRSARSGTNFRRDKVIYAVQKHQLWGFIAVFKKKKSNIQGGLLADSICLSLKLGGLE